MTTDPIRLKTRIYNNRLLEWRDNLGMGPQQFADFLGISLSTMYQLCSLEMYPCEKTACKIASKLGESPEFLFPEYLKKISSTVSVRRIPEHQLVGLIEARDIPLLADPDSGLIEDETKETISKMLESLTPREAEVIRLSFGLDGHEPMTLEEIASIDSVSRSRILQIKGKALLKMRSPQRAASKALRELAE